MKVADARSEKESVNVKMRLRLLLLCSCITLSVAIPAGIALPTNRGLKEGPVRRSLEETEDVDSCTLSPNESCPITDEVTRIIPGGDTICMDGDPYSFYARKGSVDKVLFYFVGGGSCWDDMSCDPAFGDFFTYRQVIDAIDTGVFSGDDRNVFKDWTIVAVMYCSADLFLGDTTVEMTSPSTGQPFTVHHNGFKNTMATLDWTMQNLGNPSDIVVGGCSAGSLGIHGWGNHLFTRFTEAFPGVHLTLLADSYFEAVSIPSLVSWGVSSCEKIDDVLKPACIGIVTFSSFMDITMPLWPEATFAMMNTAADSSEFWYFQAIDPTYTPERMLGEMSYVMSVHAMQPNFVSFMADGDDHCVTPYDLFFELEAAPGGAKFWEWTAKLAERGVVHGECGTSFDASANFCNTVVGLKDECADGNDMCQQTCVDMEEGYACACEEGYELTADGYGCDMKPGPDSPDSPDSDSSDGDCVPCGPNGKPRRWRKWKKKGMRGGRDLSFFAGKPPKCC